MVLGAHNFRSSGSRSQASPSGFTGLDEVYALAWPDGRMPVAFDATVSPSLQAFFFDVCGRWSTVANVRCVPAVGNEDALTVTSNSPFTGCNSVVGYSPSYRSMNLEAACWFDSVVLHEIGHALGLLHEHQRADRDAFVAIDYANVQANYVFAFNYGLGAAHGPYDLRSVMHYQWYAFSVDSSRPSLRPRSGSPAVLTAMGAGRVTASSQTFPSDGDAAAMRSIYGANEAVPGAPARVSLDAVSGNAVTLAWDAPQTGAAVQGYRIEVGSDAAFTRIVGAQMVGPDVTAGTGVLPSGIMHVRVIPIGNEGDGVPSNALTFRLPGGAPIVPPQPPIVTAQASSNPITLGWQPTGGGMPTSYTIVAGTKPNASDLGVYQTGAARTLRGDVPRDTPIYVRVIAANAAGTAVSDVLMVTVPSEARPSSAPTLLPAQVADHRVSLAWVAPMTGATPTSYRISARLVEDGPTVATWTVYGTSLVVSEVPSGAYQVSVTALVGSLAGDESNRIRINVR